MCVVPCDMFMRVVLCLQAMPQRSGNSRQQRSLRLSLWLVMHSRSTAEFRMALLLAQNSVACHNDCHLAALIFVSPRSADRELHRPI